MAASDCAPSDFFCECAHELQPVRYGSCPRNHLAASSSHCDWEVREPPSLLRHDADGLYVVWSVVRTWVHRIPTCRSATSRCVGYWHQSSQCGFGQRGKRMRKADPSVTGTKRGRGNVAPIANAPPLEGGIGTDQSGSGREGLSSNPCQMRAMRWLTLLLICRRRRRRVRHSLRQLTERTRVV